MEEEMQFIVDIAKENMDLALKHLDKEIHNCVESQETIKMGEKIEFKKVDKI